MVAVTGDGLVCFTMARGHRVSRLLPSTPSYPLMFAIIMLKMRCVSVNQGVPILVEPVEDPEPGQPAQAVGPTLVEQTGLV